MSAFSSHAEYGGSYVETKSESLDANELANIQEVKVQYSKDKEGKVLDKLCMCFVQKNGRNRYFTLDRNSTLKAGDSVKAETVKIKTLERDGDTIERVDGEAK